MTIADASTPFIESPLAAALIGAACVALVAIAGAAFRIVMQLTRLESSVADIRRDITAIQVDPDVMRWSNYGRAARSGVIEQPTHGV